MGLQIVSDLFLKFHKGFVIPQVKGFFQLLCWCEFKRQHKHCKLFYFLSCNPFTQTEELIIH